MKLLEMGFGLVLVTTACTRTESQDVLTHGMYASMGASTDGTGQTTVSATLFLGDPLGLDFVDLSGDDRLVAGFGSETKVMTESIILNIVTHTATFGSGAPGDLFDVDFQRTVDAGAPDSHGTLPEAFTIDLPPAQASRAAAFGLTWGPPTGDKVRWEARGDCIETASGAVVDPGTGELDVPANMLVVRQGATETTCPVTFTLSRETLGVVDPGFGKGGTFYGAQTRTVTFTSTP